MFVFVFLFLLLLALHNFSVDYKHFRVRNCACTVLNVQRPCTDFFIISLPHYLIVHGLCYFKQKLCGVLKYLEAIVPAFPGLLCVICWCFKTMVIPKHFEKLAFHLGILILGFCCCIPAILINLGLGGLRDEDFYVVVV